MIYAATQVTSLPLTARERFTGAGVLGCDVERYGERLLDPSGEWALFYLQGPKGRRGWLLVRCGSKAVEVVELVGEGVLEFARVVVEELAHALGVGIVCETVRPGMARVLQGWGFKSLDGVHYRKGAA